MNQKQLEQVWTEMWKLSAEMDFLGIMKDQDTDAAFNNACKQFREQLEAKWQCSLTAEEQGLAEDCIDIRFDQILHPWHIE